MANIQQYLDDLLDSGFDTLAIPDKPAGLYHPVMYTLNMGGKRLRPKLVLLTTGLCQGNPDESLPVAMAVEMLHNFTLIHDDIMDHAETRRGKATIQVKWDEPTAILAGDIFFVLAMKQLTVFGQNEPDKEGLKLKLVNQFLDSVQTVCDGQALDMEFQHRDDVRLPEYLHMIRAKTAALIQCAMQMGALCAGADDQIIRDCGDIGYHTGIAFQIQDDLLDAVGDSGKFGKKVGGDIIEGKKTFLSILAGERADDTDREILNQIMGNSNADEREILRVIRIYHDLGVIDEAVRQLTEHYNEASRKIELFVKNEYRNEIKRLLDKLKIRDN